MKKYSFTTVAILVVNLIFAQESIKKKVDDLPHNIKQYYSFINQAEKKIIANDLKKASDLYDSAFFHFKKPFSVDLYNDFIVNLELKNNEKLNELYNSLNCLKFNFETLTANNNFVSFVKQNLKLTACKNEMNLDLIKKLNSLHEKDQYFRKRSNGNYKVYKDSINKYDKLNALSLKQIIIDNGFPTEYEIGVDKRPEHFGFLQYYYIIWHQLFNNGIGQQTVNFEDYLLDAICNGKLRPDVGYKLINLNSPGASDNNIRIWAIQKNNLPEDCCYLPKVYLKQGRTKEQEIYVDTQNKLRAKIGLCSVEDEVQKLIFNLKNTKYKFKNDLKATYNYSNDDDVKFLKDAMTKISLDSDFNN
jgi:hypothetical protein